jgi:hypothetical protein
MKGDRIWLNIPLVHNLGKMVGFGNFLFGIRAFRSYNIKNLKSLSSAEHDGRLAEYGAIYLSIFLSAQSDIFIYEID